MARILIVEPDGRLAQLYAQALQLRHHQVVAVATAQAAVLAADEAKPDLVILELLLTAHGGMEFLYEFRSYADWTNVPVIILSNVPPAEFERSRDVLYGKLGVAGYYYKPRTSLQVLMHAVENFVARRQAV